MATIHQDCMTITLNQATPADIPRIRELAHRIWRVHYPPIIGEQQVEYMLGLNYDLESLQRQMEKEAQIFWLVMEAEDVLGFVAVSDQGEGVYFIHKFYLDNEIRGRGLGKRVFDLLLEKYLALREFRLTVNRQNYKSINFYFRIGFTIERCIDIPIGEGYVMSDFLMLFKR